MREIRIKNKKSNHKLRLDGKNIQFVNGKATVTDSEAELIEEQGSPEYKVMPEIPVEETIHKEEPKKKPVKRSKKR